MAITAAVAEAFKPTATRDSIIEAAKAYCGPRIRGYIERAMIEVSYHRVEEAIRLLGPKGLFICTHAPTEEAARRLLKQAGRWSCRHPWDIR